MRWLVMMLAFGGCNRAFGVVATIEADAKKFDAGIDAPFSCPPIGTPLQFSPLVHQDIAQSCTDYNISPDRGLAVALCSTPSTAVFEGPIDQPLAPAADLEMASSIAIGQPRISPEGDLLMIQTYDTNAFVSTHRIYQRAGDGWTYLGDLPVDPYGQISTVTRGPTRHLMVLDGTTTLTEWVGDLATWTQLPTTFVAPAAPYHVWLGADGLRMLLTVSGAINGIQLIYSDRATIDDPFSTPVTVPTIPVATDPFVTEDCSRVYVSSVGTIFYAQQ